MNSQEAARLLTGHGRVICKLCSVVLASCRCMTPHEPHMVICDKCLKTISEYEHTLSQGEGI